jgi:hypothetical protein
MARRELVSKRCDGFLLMELLVSMGLVLVLLVVLKGYLVLRFRIEEAGSRLVERERILNHFIADWMESDDAVLVVSPDNENWRVLHVASLEWVPAGAYGSSHVYRRTLSPREDISGWDIYYRVGKDWDYWAFYPDKRGQFAGEGN